MPDSRGRTRAHPGRRTEGSSRFTRRSGASGPATRPGMRAPTVLAATYRATERYSSSAIMRPALPRPASPDTLRDQDARRSVRPAPVLDRPPALASHAVQRHVGVDRHRVADRAEQGQIRMAVRVRIAPLQVDVLHQRVLAQPGGPRLAD